MNFLNYAPSNVKHRKIAALIPDKIWMSGFTPKTLEAFSGPVVSLMRCCKPSVKPTTVPIGFSSFDNLGVSVTNPSAMNDSGLSQICLSLIGL